MLNCYKCFNSELESQYGDKFYPNVIYHTDGKIKFQQNGFHMCANLEDTLRYFDSFNNQIIIANVIGFGNYDKYDDYYNEYFDMFATEYMMIEHVLEREEITSYALKLSDTRLKRFLSLYKLNEFELELFKRKYYKDNFIMPTIEYYQSNKNKILVKKTMFK